MQPVHGIDQLVIQPATFKSWDVPNMNTIPHYTPNREAPVSWLICVTCGSMKVENRKKLN